MLPLRISDGLAFFAIPRILEACLKTMLISRGVNWSSDKMSLPLKFPFIELSELLLAIKNPLLTLRVIQNRQLDCQRVLEFNSTKEVLKGQRLIFFAKIYR